MFPADVQKILQRLRRTIRDAAPQAEEVISYGISSYKLCGFLVHFGAFRNHIGFFPTSSPRQKFKSELSEYKGGKGHHQVPARSTHSLHALVRKIVKFRVGENLLGEARVGRKKMRAGITTNK